MFFLFTGRLSPPKIVREKNEALTRFLRAYIEAMIKATGRFLKISDRETLESVYDEYKSVFPVTPLMTAAEVQAVLDVSKSPQAKSIKAEDFFDNSIVQKIQASGFLEQVNRK